MSDSIKEKEQKELEKQQAAKPKAAKKPEKVSKIVTDPGSIATTGLSSDNDGPIHDGDTAG